MVVAAMSSTAAKSGRRGEEGRRKPFWSEKEVPESGERTIGGRGSIHSGGEPDRNDHKVRPTALQWREKIVVVYLVQ